eukprot:TRINITY_DN9961_c0_g1_i1.p3 TRINITY_DN9961_c0_g1~~TRINITY_DN9961_c0_g1_i1.p3  ORF type:complete len:50 (-),score=31.63 TRINITY_DN9961_c0_g1_i1:2-151(-)
MILLLSRTTHLRSRKFWLLLSPKKQKIKEKKKKYRLRGRSSETAKAHRG